MASYTVSKAKHATLAASTVDTVTLGWNSARTEIINRSLNAPLYFTVGSTAPTVGGDDSYVVLPGGSLIVDTPGASATVVKLIAAAANDYSVTAL